MWFFDRMRHQILRERPNGNEWSITSSSVSASAMCSPRNYTHINHKQLIKLSRAQHILPLFWWTVQYTTAFDNHRMGCCRMPWQPKRPMANNNSIMWSRKMRPRRKLLPLREISFATVLCIHHFRSMARSPCSLFTLWRPYNIAFTYSSRDGECHASESKPKKGERV